MPSSLREERLGLLMQSLATLLPESGIDEETAVAALRRAFANPADLAPALEGDALPLEGRMLLSHILAVWGHSGEYCDDAGQPLALPGSGPPPSIQALHEQAINDLPGAADIPSLSTSEEMLRHLEDNLCIETTSDGRWRQLRSFYAANEAQRASAVALLEYAIDFLHTSNTNFTNGPSHFQRIAQTPRFPVAKLAKINQLLEEHGMEFLRLIDSYITAEVASAAVMKDHVQMGVGVYLYRRDAPPK